MKLKKLINEHFLGQLPSEKLQKMKWNPLTTQKEPIQKEQADDLEVTDDPITEVNYDHKLLRRGQGLVNMKNMKAFINGSQGMAADLEEEGWDSEDITDFFIAFARKSF